MRKNKTCPKRESKPLASSHLNGQPIPDQYCYSETPIQLKSDGFVWMVKCSRYRPGVVQRVGRCIVLLFHYRGTRRGWVVRRTPRQHFTPGKDPVPIVQEAGWAPGPVWTGGKYRPHRDLIPDRPACSQSLYRLSYRAHALFECTS